MFRILIIYIVCSISSTMAFCQDRNVSWLHGLGGSGIVWDDVEDEFDMVRKINTADNSPSYNSFNGITPPTTSLMSILPTDMNSLVVGHSMGGIVARNIDIASSGNKMGGIITVGSPNNGAAIANSLINGDVGRATETACNSLFAGPTSEIPGINIIINSIIPEVICEVMEHTLVESLLESQNNPSTTNLAVQSTQINSLNLGTSGIPLISIWGDERSPVHWRLVSSIETSNTDENKWVNTAEDFRSFYNDIFLIHTSAAVVTGVLGFINPAFWTKTISHSYRAFQWKRGANWFDRSESIWNGLIDCKGEIVTIQAEVLVPSETYNCACYYGGNYDQEYEACLNYWISECEQDPNDCWVTISENIYIRVNDRSDGFICEDSQIGNLAIESYRAEGDNHYQETYKNSSTFDQLTTCFDRTDFFHVDPR